MEPDNRKAAWRIGLVSSALALLVSPVAWWQATETAEQNVVSLAMEESQRLIHFFGDQADANTARALTGGLFDIAEIYDAQGRKVAEHATPAGHAVEQQLRSHGQPRYLKPSYESVHLPSGTWVLRVFVPLRRLATPGEHRTGALDPLTPIDGYFEGVRVVPDWQRQQIRDDALRAGLLALMAALLCGAALYPVVVHLSAENRQRARRILQSHLAMMEALGRAIAKRDSDTGAHNYRVAWIATRIAESMRVDTPAMQALIVGAFLHDVGKIGIPDAVLLKPARLDADEFEVMRTHVALGQQIVQGIEWLETASAVVGCHHEKWDGSGYPAGLLGTQIPLAARIFAVADVFDALCSRRPYKEPLPFDAVMDILRRDSGTHFDPSVVAAFEPIAREVHDRLLDATEDDCRALLERKLTQHFGLELGDSVGVHSGAPVRA